MKSSNCRKSSDRRMNVQQLVHACCTPCCTCEAAMKSMKHHLRKVTGKSILTYDDMTTIVCQIEKVLNNRPLMAFTNNPEDILALTPSIHVKGSRLDQTPQPCLLKINPCLVKHFCILKSGMMVFRICLHHFNFEANGDKNVKISQLVTDDEIPPLQWGIVCVD